jgi:hypothetical protein
VTDAANGIFVDATRTDTDSDDIAQGLTNCVTRDGQSPATANIPMGGFKLTGMANGTVAGDAVNFGQVFTAPTFVGLTATGVVNFAGATSVSVPTMAPGTNSTAAASTAFAVQLAMQAALPAQALGFLVSSGAVASFGQTHTGYAQKEVKGADIVCAATIDLTAATGNLVHVTGSTGPVTAITVASGAEYTIVWDSTPSITNHATTLIIPGGSRTVAAGEVWKVRGDGAGNARVVDIMKPDGTAVAVAAQNYLTTAQFDKTSDVTLAAIPGLSATLVAGVTYKFSILAFTTSVAGGGVKFGFAGTATATSFAASSPSSPASQRVTALASALDYGASTEVVHLISGVIVCNAGGTFNITFAQSNSNGTASSVLVNSLLSVDRIS